MKKYHKILVVGSNSVHVINFIKLIAPLFENICYLGNEKLDKIDDLPIKQYLVNSKNYLSINKNISVIRKIFTDEQPDIVHIHQVNKLAIQTVFALHKMAKIVTTAWGSDVLIEPKKNIIKRAAVKYVLRNSNYCTADSKNMLDVMRQIEPKIKNSKHAVFGIDVISCEINQKENIIYSNRLLKPLYNIDIIIGEFNTFLKSNPNWLLIIGADGFKKEELELLVKKLNLSEKVKFVGWLDKEKNIDWYRRSKIYVSIPSSDGTSVSLLEAMSAGCIPVVSNLPVSKEWITDGINGIIKDDKENCFTRAVQLNIKDVSEKNKKIISETATKEIALQNFNSIYQTISI